MSPVLHWPLLCGWSCDRFICRCHKLPLRGDSNILPSEFPTKQESALTSVYAWISYQYQHFWPLNTSDSLELSLNTTAAMCNRQFHKLWISKRRYSGENLLPLIADVQCLWMIISMTGVM